MPIQLKYFLLGLVSGILFPYLIGILDLFSNVLVNLQTLHTNKIQRKIDEINPQYEIKESAIGFRVDNDTSMDEYKDE